MKDKPDYFFYAIVVLSTIIGAFILTLLYITFTTNQSPTKPTTKQPMQAKKYEYTIKYSGILTILADNEEDAKDRSGYYLPDNAELEIVDTQPREKVSLED